MMKIKTNVQLDSEKGIQAAVFVGGTVVLLGTWCLLFIRLLGLGEITCDYIWSWGRPVNDFWRVFLDSAWLAVIVVAANVGSLVVGIVRTTSKVYLPLTFAALNFVFGLADFVLGQLAYEINAALLPRPRPLVDPIHHYIWPQILVTIASLIVFFFVQSLLVFRKVRRA